MRDVRIAEKAGRQFNRISWSQLRGLGLSEAAIRHRIAAGRLVIVERGVLAVAPVNPEDDWGKWMGAVLTHPRSSLSHLSAAAARGFWSLPREHETITRPGSGGPRMHGGVLVHRSETLDGNTAWLRGLPLTTTPRTLLDIAAHESPAALARSVREAVRLKRTSLREIADLLGANRGRRGAARLAATIARYRGLPLERARSGAEVRAMEILSAAGRPLPNLNFRIAGEEADLSWPRHRLIIEIDGGPFHLDRGEDARKQAAWEGAGWSVRRIPSDAVYEHPALLLDLAPTSNVPHTLR